VPPTAATPLIVRSIDYTGEEHPATIKRSIVVPVAHLPLKNADAIHRLKLFAGTRWTPEPPKNAGWKGDEKAKEQGFVHISCEDFPKPAMNIKWASDALDRLVTEANVRLIHLIVLFLKKHAY
jgi:small subunit ribosomal protein S35